MHESSSPSSTRPTLLLRLRDAGDDAAWTEFEAMYRDLVLRYCRRCGLQPADADDVRQIVFTNLSRSLPRFEYRPDSGRFRDYLGVVVRNVIRRHAAGQIRSAAGLLGDDALLDVPAPDDSASGWNDEWMLHHYRRAMETIRSTFERRTLDVFDAVRNGDVPEEIARRFATTVDAVYKTKQRVRERLAELIERQLREEEFRDEPRD